MINGFTRMCVFAGAGIFGMLAIEAGAAELSAAGTEELPAFGDAEPPALGAESGTIGGLDYSVTRDQMNGGARVCLAAAGEGSSSQDLGSIDGSGNGSVCVTVTPPPPDSGVEDPFSATVTVAVPTPEGVIEAQIGTFTDPNGSSTCVAISVSGEGVEPESVEVCLPPDDGEAPEIPECVNPDDPLESPALPEGDPSGVEGLPDDASLPSGESLSSSGEDTGEMPLDPLLSLLPGNSGESPLPGLGEPAED